MTRFDAVVEIPRGSRNKYEMDHRTGRIRLDRMLFTATQYPCDYGFVPGTLAEDGDPLDLLNEIGHFFDVYKDLEPGKDTDTRGWQDRAQAECVVTEAYERHDAQPVPGGPVRGRTGH